ncbi:DUF6090 family protein [Algoriphagus halophilus]|uniref:Uncharacterized protein n=1 Tax=Algoriphagus halophilus TaxID=226505 RepID=A0A1N6G0Y6_9BACT|nr:DUF6090 family protein [Algoriphagus halophilus]SIO01246.1 hypothetical protein SAMN05444394_2888 [Algoriphagus halophilus]
MISFFRKIRQKLLAQNRVTRYLAYAVGEILLVVIGILIALQVNNWNEERKNNKIREVFRSSLKKDLQADTSYLKATIQKLQLESEQLTQFKSLINEIGTDKNALIGLINTKMVPFITPFSGFNNNTYRSFANSGRLELISLDLQEDLFKLNSFQVIVERDSEKYIDLYFSNIEAFKLPIPVDIQLLQNGPVTDAIWKATNIETIGVRLNSWGTSKKNYYRIILPYLNQAQERTTQILKKYFSEESQN